MNRVFILGAGASRFAGYPLNLELWSFIRDRGGLDVVAERRSNQVKAAMDSILKVLPPDEYDRPNLEELFTLLDLAEVGVKPLMLARVQWRQIRPKLMGMIADQTSHPRD